MPHKKPYVEKKADYTTVLCFIRPSRREYTPKDAHIIGKTLAEMYKKHYGNAPRTVEQVEGRKVIPVNLFPSRYKATIKKVVEEYFAMKEKKLSLSQDNK